MESFLLQARNIRLFIPIFLVAVGYTTVSTLGYSTVVEPLLTRVFYDAQGLWGANPVWPGYANQVVETRIHAGYLVAASTAYLLVTAFTTGPAILTVAVSAAVTACSGEQRSSSFHALVRKLLLAGGDGLKGPFGTALLGHVLHGVACRGALEVFRLHIQFFRRYTSSGLLPMVVLLFRMGHIFALYVEVACTLAVVVSAAEPAGCFYGAHALRQAWWIMAGKTTPAVILVLIRGVVKAVMETVYIRRIAFVYHYYNVAYAILSGFVYAALQLWFVCATTIYYYKCTQHNDGYCSMSWADRWVCIVRTLLIVRHGGDFAGKEAEYKKGIIPAVGGNEEKNRTPDA